MTGPVDQESPRTANPALQDPQAGGDPTVRPEVGEQREESPSLSAQASSGRRAAGIAQTLDPVVVEGSEVVADLAQLAGADAANAKG